MKGGVADVDVGADAGEAAVASVEMTVTLNRETADGVAEVVAEAGFVHPSLSWRSLTDVLSSEAVHAHPLPVLPHPEDAGRPPAPLP